jgi:hypothetical protein
MFRDEHRRTVWDQLRQHDLRAFAKLLPKAVFGEAAKRAGVTLGEGPLYLVNLVWLGLASALHTAKSFADLLTLTLKLLQDAPEWESTPLATARQPGRGRSRGRRRSKHDPRRRDPLVVTEEAFVQARKRMPPGYWMALLGVLCERFATDHAESIHWKPYWLMALDGTCVNLQADKRLADHFGTASNGHGGRRPQARLVMLQFPQVRLPFRYELGPLRHGERTMAARLLTGLQPNDLILMDRGFWSYGLFWQIQRQNAFFGIRLMKGVRVKTLRRLGRKDRLVRWTPTERKWKRAGLPASIDLRMIDYQIKGFRPSVVVTSVLDPRAISREEWVRVTTASELGRTVDPGLYHRRWEIETTFCELKVRQGMESSLRGRTPETIVYEIAGHVLFYHLVRWLMVEAAVDQGLDPLRLSFLSALRELQDMSPTLLVASPERVSQVLLPRLVKRIAQHRVAPRPGRHYPRPQDTQVKYAGKGKYRVPSKLAINQA